MPTRRRSALVLVVVLAARRTGTESPTAPNATAPIAGVSFAKPVDPGYKVYQDGSTTDAQTQPIGGAYLAGGATDVDAGMVWLMGQGGTRSAGKYGDVVVLRTSGSNGYNKYLVRLGANSVTSIVITSVAGANSDAVNNAIAKAAVVFIAGGDQSTYVNLWRGTALQTAVNARVAQGYPIGGTSAGLAVLGQYPTSGVGFVVRALGKKVEVEVGESRPVIGVMHAYRRTSRNAKSRPIAGAPAVP